MLKNILLKKLTKYEKICIISFSFIFLFIQTIGYNCSKYNSARLNSIGTYIFILFIPIFYYLFKILFNLSFKEEKNSFIISNKKLFLISFTLIILAWLPIIISFYPNNYSVDASTQTRMVIYNIISKYHPVIHTIFLGGLLKLSNILFNQYTIGNFVYGIIQAMIMDIIFSYFIVFLKKEKAPNWLIILSMLLFMFLPTNSVLAITTTKDVIFSGLILLIVIKFYYIVNNKNYLNNNKNIISIIIIILLSLMFRNNMIYALFLFLIPIVLILKKQRKKSITHIYNTNLLIFYL